MANFKPRKIIGEWRKGFALDLQTLSSEFIGHDEFGHPKFDTKRSEIGELLYQLKYKSDMDAVQEIVKAVEKFMKTWNPTVDILVPIPPATHRAVQPVLVLANAISKRLGIPLADCVTRTRDIKELKNVSDLDERLNLLEGLHTVDKSATRGKSVLIFDDLYRSGATMNAITTELFEAGNAADVFALAITRTRSHQ